MDPAKCHACDADKYDPWVAFRACRCRLRPADGASAYRTIFVAPRALV